MFKKSLSSNRCLVPCTGFFEWSSSKGNKHKFRIYPAGEKFFYLAGLYSSFYKDGAAQERFVIITAPANESMKPIHERMPLMLRSDDKEAWLGSKTDIEAIYNSITKLDKIAV